MIFPSTLYRFITTKGEQISCSSVSMSFDTLSRAAGYATRFFTSHRRRQGFSCRLAAIVLRQGGNANDVYAIAGPTEARVAAHRHIRVHRLFPR